MSFWNQNRNNFSKLENRIKKKKSIFTAKIESKSKAFFLAKRKKKFATTFCGRKKIFKTDKFLKSQKNPKDY